MDKLTQEIEMANRLAKLCRRRVAVVQVHSVICAIEYNSVEPHETVLYVTI
jgi:hypothetical protein